MKVFGFDDKEILYELSNIIGGIGVGIIISNTFRLSFKIGLTISAISLIFSIYMGHKYIRNSHKKNYNE